MSWIQPSTTELRHHHTHHTDSIIQQWLPEQHYVQHLVDVNLLEHGQHRDRIHGREQRREHEAVQEVERANPGERTRLQSASKKYHFIVHTSIL